MNSVAVKQIFKFVVVGFINTAIDFAVLNTLMFMTNIYSGKLIIIFNSISFTAAIINSYFMNKYWTFQSQITENSGEKTPKEFIQFIAVGIIGISINDAIVYAVSTFIPPIFGLSIKLWTNAAKILATAVSMIWNFIGYKFFVFKK